MTNLKSAQSLASPAFQKRHLLSNRLISTQNLNDDTADHVDYGKASEDEDEEQKQEHKSDEKSIAEVKVEEGHEHDAIIEQRQPQERSDEDENQMQVTPESDDLLDESDVSAQYDDEEERNHVAYTIADQNFRYELVHWDDHLRDVARLWSQAERASSSEWNDIWKALLHFLRHSPEAFRSWQQLKIFDEYSSLFTGRIDTVYNPSQIAAAMELPELAEILIGEGEDIHQRTTATDQHGWRQTPLEIASNSGSLDIARVFLKHGADPNSQGNGHTAFHWAVYINPTCECIQLYLDHGAKLDIIDGWGYNVLHMLSKTPADPEPDVLQLLIRAGGDINVADKIGETPLHKLMQRDKISIELLEAYLREGALVNIEDHDLQSKRVQSGD